MTGKTIKIALSVLAVVLVGIALGVIRYFDGDLPLPLAIVFILIPFPITAALYIAVTPRVPRIPRRSRTTRS